MKYDRAELERLGLWRLEGDDYYILSYPPKRKATLATEFVLDFKNNDPEAVRIGKEFYLTALKKDRKYPEKDQQRVRSLNTCKQS